MRAALMYGAGDVRVEEVADPKLEQPTDALVRIVRACVCGSDLHPYHQLSRARTVWIVRWATSCSCGR